jgi:2-polyprenyl-3-methyl-5-hydroxy-6-metoxy-1,4-benzoquinol methylase
MRGGAKRRETDGITDVQAGNQEWWTQHTMSYDWNAPIQLEKYSLPWFGQADERFIFGARLFAHDKTPFDLILPLQDLKGKRVLEIGCGMGLHSELMARAGAKLTSIDLSETSIAATSRRFALKGLKGDVRQMDAERLAFPDGEFDFVWSWGVIHHSSHTGRVVREIHRVLKPGGEARVMVYHLGGMPAYVSMLLEYGFGFWRGRSLDEYLWAASDGFTARHYSRDMLRDLFLIFFDNVAVEVYGQDADAMPVPRQIRPWALRLVSTEWQKRKIRQRGAFVFARAHKAAA